MYEHAHNAVSNVGALLYMQSSSVREWSGALRLHMYHNVILPELAAAHSTFRSREAGHSVGCILHCRMLRHISKIQVFDADASLFAL